MKDSVTPSIVRWYYKPSYGSMPVSRPEKLYTCVYDLTQHCTGWNSLLQLAALEAVRQIR
eukprot:1719723-Rhodomonas_salina.1